MEFGERPQLDPAGPRWPGFTTNSGTQRARYAHHPLAGMVRDSGFLVRRQWVFVGLPSAGRSRPRSSLSMVRSLRRVEIMAGHIGAVNWHAVRLYWLSRRLWLGDHQAAALVIAALNRVLTGVEIPPQASFGQGLVIMHGNGIVVHPLTRAGQRCTLFHQTTIGSRTEHGPPPTIGDDVTVCPGAKLLGGISIGDGAPIGAHAGATRCTSRRAGLGDAGRGIGRLSGGLRMDCRLGSSLT